MKKKKEEGKVLPTTFIILKAHYFIKTSNNKLAVAAGYQLFV